MDSIKQEKFTQIPMDSEHWSIVFDGGGEVVFEPLSRSLSMKPKAPTKESETYAALVVLKSLPKPLADYAVRVEVSSYTQIRRGTPNDWEVFWFFGNYRWAPNGKKEANYFILKPRTGVEFGTVFEEVGQNFLKTKTEPVLKMGERIKLLFIKQGPHFRVYQDDRLILTYRDGEAPEKMFSHPGTFGLYSEDAFVRVHSFEYRAL